MFPALLNMTNVRTGVTVLLAMCIFSEMVNETLPLSSKLPLLGTLKLFFFADGTM